MNYFKSTIFTVLAISILAFLSGCSGTSPEYSQYRSDLKYQMQDMINVLNVGHNTEFMEKYVDPSYLQRMGESIRQRFLSALTEPVHCRVH